MGEPRLNDMALSEKAKIRIRQYINKMDLEKSNKLPREETLADMIGVSRVTIRTALNDLAAEGTIFRRQGKGTFVNVDSLNIKVKFNPMLEFTEMIRNSGYTPSVKILGTQLAPCSEAIAKKIQLGSDDRLVMSEKIFFADDRLCAFCVDFFPLSAIGNEEALEDCAQYENSIFTYIYSRSGRKIVWDKVEIDTKNGENIPNLLQYVPDKSLATKPFLLLKGVNYDMDDRPLLYAKEYIDTEIIRFNMIRQRNIHFPDVEYTNI